MFMINPLSLSDVITQIKLLAQKVLILCNEKWRAGPNFIELLKQTLLDTLSNKSVFPPVFSCNFKNQVTLNFRRFVLYAYVGIHPVENTGL